MFTRSTIRQKITKGMGFPNPRLKLMREITAMTHYKVGQLVIAKVDISNFNGTAAAPDYVTVKAGRIGVVRAFERDPKTEGVVKFEVDFGWMKFDTTTIHYNPWAITDLTTVEKYK